MLPIQTVRVAHSFFRRQNLVDDDVVLPTIAEIVEVDETVRYRRRNLIQPYGAVVRDRKVIILRRFGKNSTLSVSMKNVSKRFFRFLPIPTRTTSGQPPNHCHLANLSTPFKRYSVPARMRLENGDRGFDTGGCLTPLS